MAKVFITGITGFLGSNTAKVLLEKGHQIVATYRPNASLERCSQFKHLITWIELGENWEKQVVQYKPDIIIHAAWIGVTHAERNDWDIQYQNINQLYKLLNIAGECGVQKVIGLGSQAEYGIFEGPITESYTPEPIEAYGCVKVICSELLKQYAGHHHIDWYWLRLFSFFGKGESESWLIPSLIKKMQTQSSMDFTPGGQKYAYLYADDLGRAIDSIIGRTGCSGIYNISGKQTITLRHLIESIRNFVNPQFQLNFGGMPYRPNQIMHMQGDTTAFVAAFGEFEVSDFNTALTDTIEDLKQRLIK